MKKNIIVLSIVAVLGVSQVAGMNSPLLELENETIKNMCMLGEGVEQEPKKIVEVDAEVKCREIKTKEEIEIKKESAQKTIAESMETFAEALAQAAQLFKKIKDNRKATFFAPKKLDPLTVLEVEAPKVEKKQVTVFQVEAPKVEKKQGFFSSMYNKVANSKKAVVAGLCAGLVPLVAGVATMILLLPNMV